MAYSVLIIDDEPLAREGLRSMCDWSSEGFEVVAEASSAEEAIRVIEKDHIDLVLTDIVMNGDSGLELLRRIAQRYPRTQRIVISCHDRFEYATESMRAGALDYLFKLSLDGQSLKKAVRKAAEKLNQLHSGSQSDNRFRKVLRPIHAKDTGVSTKSACEVGVLGVGPGNEAWSEAADNYVRSYLAEEICIVRLSPENSDLRLFICTPLTHRETMRTATHLWHHLRFNCKVAVSVQFQHGFWNAEACAIAAEALLDTNGFAHFFPLGTLVCAAPSGRTGQGGLSLEEGEELRRFVRSWRLNEACATAVNMLEKRARGGLSFSLLRSISTEIMWTLRQELPADSPGQITNVESKINGAESLFELAVACTYPVVRHISSGKHHRDFRGNESIGRVCTYLADNITRRITLDEAATVANMSASYLSSRFKDAMGESFMNYSNRIRIESAARMLSTGVDVREVAEYFGYYDQSYFYRLFKRVMGITPGTAAGKRAIQ